MRTHVAVRNVVDTDGDFPYLDKDLIVLIFTVLDPHEEDGRKEFLVWKYDESSFVRVLAADVFKIVGLEKDSGVLKPSKHWQWRRRANANK